MKSVYNVGMSKRRLGLVIGVSILVISVAVAAGFIFFRKSPPPVVIVNKPQLRWQSASTTPCDPTKPPRAGLSSNSNPTLKKLAEYEAVCQSTVNDQAMIFAPMPVTEQDAAQFATTMADNLRAFASVKMTPLVVFEPTTNSPTIIADIRAYTYDSVFTSYFQALKAAGITDDMMGTWVLFPEANTPTWHNTSAGDFAANVTKLAKLQKSYFPTSKTSLLLNNQTYASDSSDHGEYKSLLPYLKDISKGLIDSFGYQAFPYTSLVQNNFGDGRLQPTHFLPTNLAQEAAKQLGVKDVWLNSGTFGRKVIDQNRTVDLSMARRAMILRGIVAQAFVLKQSGLRVSLNLFAQNKLATVERTDWSYWPAGQYQNSDGATLFRQLVHNLRDNHISLSLYDM